MLYLQKLDKKMDLQKVYINRAKIDIEEQVKNSGESLKNARKENQLLLHSFYKNGQLPKE